MLLADSNAQGGLSHEPAQLGEQEASGDTPHMYHTDFSPSLPKWGAPSPLQQYPPGLHQPPLQVGSLPLTWPECTATAAQNECDTDAAWSHLSVCGRHRCSTDQNPRSFGQQWFWWSSRHHCLPPSRLSLSCPGPFRTPGPPPAGRRVPSLLLPSSCPRAVCAQGQLSLGCSLCLPGPRALQRGQVSRGHIWNVHTPLSPTPRPYCHVAYH